MKFATLDDGSRDGALLVVSKDLRYAVTVPAIAATLQAALDDWTRLAPRLAQVYRQLNARELVNAIRVDPVRFVAPLPRAFQWLDASAYVNHVELVRRARGAELPERFWTDPLMYQGMSDGFIAAHGDIVAVEEAHGIDLEAEIAVVLDDVPLGVSAADAGGHIRLLTLVNDVSLRHLIPDELAKGFGFVHGKPASALSPFAVTPDELGQAWDGERVHGALRVDINGEPFGRADAGRDMVFGFPQLIAHAAKTRALGAGTVLGSGTVSNKADDGGPGRPLGDGGVGYSCIAEQRVVEQILHGAPRRQFLRFGDRVTIDMLDGDGSTLFGRIDQTVRRHEPPSQTAS